LKPAGWKAVVPVFIASYRNSADGQPSNKGATPDLSVFLFLFSAYGKNSLPAVASKSLRIAGVFWH
jgi:hypothetical protein